MKKFGLAFAAMMLLPMITTQSHAQVKKYGITVDNCEFDYDGEDFCTDKRLKSYAKVLKDRKANFDRNKILYIFETNEEGYVRKKPYRMVVINKTTKVVSPFYYALSGAADSRGNPKVVNAKGDNIEFDFNLNSNRFCFKGNIDAYKNSYGYEDGPFCFRYENQNSGLVREY